MFQPFLQHLEKELFSRFDLSSRPIDPELEFQISQRGKNPAMIESWYYKCPQFRKIRYTYINAGETAQMFNSVIYPSYEYDLPLLGIDFLAFGKKKILVVLDFQPLFRDEDYLEKYIDPIAPIRQKYNELAQDLEMKFYDANQYFSPYLLFAKTDAANIERITKAQKDYDQYSAERDPASGLFSSYFGHEWSEEFVPNFLFEDSAPLAVK